MSSETRTSAPQSPPALISVPPHAPVPDTHFGRWLVLLFEFGLFLIVLYRFDLETRALLHVGILCFFGFAIHYLLPLRYRMPFFLFLSLCSIQVVFGLKLERFDLAGAIQGLWIMALGLALIGICYLPVSFRIR